MSKYRIKTRVRVMNGTLKDNVGEIVYSTNKPGNCPVYSVKFDGMNRIIEYAETDIQAEDLMDEPVYEYEYFNEMATIARDQDEGILISVNPEREHLTIPYFKVYDSYSVDTAKRVARLHFKDSGMEYHKDPLGKMQWVINNRDVKNIRKVLQKRSKRDKPYTYWQIACFQWNYENGLIDDNINQYFAGKYDEMFEGDTRLEKAYVPSTQEMPDTWIYDPPKGKK